MNSNHTKTAAPSSRQGMGTRLFPGGAAFRIWAPLAVMMALWVLVFPTPAASAPAAYDIVVSTTADEYDTSGSGTGCSLREAIKTQNSGVNFGGCVLNFQPGISITKIYVPTGTYTLTRVGSGEDLDVTGDLDILVGVNIIGTGAVNITASPGWNDRILHIVGGTVTLQGIEISGGAIPNGAGGGIYNAGTTTLTSVTLVSNSTAGGGGAIYNVGTLTLNSDNLNGNSAANGGGIYNDGTATLTNTTIGSNSAANGGGIYNNNKVTVTGGAIDGNSANNNGSGGGIYNNAGTVTLSNVTLGSNTGSDSGGGIDNYIGAATLTNVTLNSNSTTNYGGGIYNTGIISNGIIVPASITLTNVSLNGNSSAFAGGGIANFLSSVVITATTLDGNAAKGGGGIWNDGWLTVTNATFNGNSAISSGNGGGIYNYGGNGILKNVTLSHNTAVQGGGIFDYNNYAQTVLTLQNTILDQLFSGGNCAAVGLPDPSNGYNLSSDASCAGLNQVGDLNSTDPKLAPLGNNGGPTLTQMPSAGSPALDQIPNGTNGCGTTIATDQRGQPRPANVKCDIGAVERQVSDGPLLYLPLILK